MTSTSPKSPRILAFIRDSLLPALKTRLHRIDLELEGVPAVASLIDSDTSLTPNEPGEPVHGRDGSIFNQIVQRQPLLMVFDADNPQTDWRRWVAICKSSAATRRIPIILIADQVDADLRRQQRNYGADLLAPAAKFLEDVPQIIQKYDRRPDEGALSDACAEPLSELALKGMALFNAGEYFDAHEELEHAWNEDRGPARELYRGILQVGVAYMQVERGNYNGAIKMLMRVKQWLDPLPPVCRTVDVARLRADAAAVYDALLAGGPDQLESFDRSLFKPLVYGDSQPS